MGEVTIYVAGRVPGYMNIGDTVYVSDRAPVEQPSAALAQPSPAQAEQAEVERPEVVAWRYGFSGGIVSDKACLDEWKSGGEYQSLMTVAQHEHIVGALRARNEKLEADAGALEWLRSTFKVHKAIVEQAGCGTIEQLAEQRDAANARLHEVSTACATAEQERDAALARVAELEKQEPVATIAKVPGEDWNGLHFYRDLQGMQPGTKLYAAPVAQAQQLHDLDKQCRDDVARALGLRPSQDRGFAWSYLLASIKSCVKAAEDAAQAQHSVPIAPQLKRALGLVVAALEADGDRPTSKYALSELKKVLAAAPGKEVPQAWIDVQAERRRQVEAEGWTPEHDDLYCAAELPRAAAAYILSGANDEAPAIWPFVAKWWKPRDARANYVRAGALILAEIERLDRAAAPGKEGA